MSAVDMTNQGGSMSENLREQIREAVMLGTGVEQLADAVLAVVGPVLDRLRAEVERERESAQTAWAVHREHVDMMNPRLLHWQAVADEQRRRAESAEAELERLRAVLADVEALERAWSDALGSGCPTCGPLGGTFADCDHAEGYHHALSDLRAALASVPEPSDEDRHGAWDKAAPLLNALSGAISRARATRKEEEGAS